MTAETPHDSLNAPYSLQLPFNRTVGPTIGAFLGGLREGRLFGTRTDRGTVLCPAAEFDPETARATGELVELAETGTVRHWTWVPRRAGDDIPHDYAWALISIDGAEGGLFHAVDTGGDPARMTPGLRVTARWRDERVGSIRDIVCFEPVAS
ncbi:Zn-ribbon domain-containing OB-fold protein [Nocardia cyriacigeorgica]|uniref:Zn-ribbon domain-containing OB-fold protein n=1 Tax=Nocardia cyriacigeorgica TaxID=135487 RepID=UPI001893BC2F|nr:OB-fold domain-containing protein [Nocardia cyriacigeorgica]MBF6455702.1 OB-fold domain-containing protein [Nocardia cyriacigeorgica]MBF6477571.1 OB-fold domain-containing protein [Nocardia cyriacigeorgica]MBF6553556.1 OB-fold domain-containing protein [Nocardia cyriacigeorgica]